MADSMGLVVADAAARAVEFVGLPEAGLNLAHAVIYLATAPKSNTTMAGLSRAFDDVRQRQAGAVPSPLRSVAPVPAQQAEGGRRLPLPAQRPVGLRRPGVPPARDRRRDRLAGAARLLPALAPRRRGRGRRPPAGMVGRRPLRRRAVVGVREVPRPRALTGGSPGHAADVVDESAGGNPGVWVPRTLARHASCTYSCTRPVGSENSVTSSVWAAPLRGEGLLLRAARPVPHHLLHQRCLSGSKTQLEALSVRFYAARSYSLISPPRIGRRLICWQPRSGAA